VYLFEKFQSDGALPGDDFRVVEGMNEGTALFGLAAQGLFAGLVVAGAVQNGVASGITICARMPRAEA
jgi:hypothetical protein